MRIRLCETIRDMVYAVPQQIYTHNIHNTPTHRPTHSLSRHIRSAWSHLTCYVCVNVFVRICISTVCAFVLVGERTTDINLKQQLSYTPYVPGCVDSHSRRFSPAVSPPPFLSLTLSLSLTVLVCM